MGATMRNKTNWMTTIRLTVLLCILVSVLAACAPVSNGLMREASPETSALTLYIYEGSEVRRFSLFNTEETKSLLEKLDSVKSTKVEGWTLGDITLPVYGLETGTTDGDALVAAWSNGYWITQNGAAYSFDFDFASLEQSYNWKNESSFPSFNVFPCAHFLSQDESGWNTTLLTPAVEPAPPPGISMILKSFDSTGLRVYIANNSGSEWMYGETFVLQALLGNSWYEVPTLPGRWMFSMVGIIVRDGEVKQHIYTLESYGDLPAGVYRVAAFGLSAEFSVE